MRSRAAVWLAFSCLLFASAATAGVIGGTLSPPARSRIAARLAPIRLTDAVIYVEKVPESVERRLESRGFWFFRWSTKSRVRQVVEQDRRFDPQVVATTVGDRIAFHNLDRVYHSVFSVSAAKQFDLEKRLPGQRDTMTLDRRGVINLHCEIHPDMVGYVVVTPNHAFTFPDSTGRYRLPALPEGTYTVRAFHPRWGEIQRHVDVAKRGDVTLDLKF